MAVVLSERLTAAQLADARCGNVRRPPLTDLPISRRKTFRVLRSANVDYQDC